MALEPLCGRDGEASPCVTSVLSRPCVPPDEHLSAGKHRHAELGPSAALYEHLPGAPRAAGLPWPPQRPQAGAAHLDFQPQRHPDGPRREGAPLHGLRLTSQARILALSVPAPRFLRPCAGAGSPLGACLPRVPQGRGQLCYFCMVRDRLLLVPPLGSEACTHHSAGCGPSVTRSLSCPRGRGSRRSLGMLCGLCSQARKSINTVIAAQPRSAFSSRRPPFLKCCSSWPF